MTEALRTVIVWDSRSVQHQVTVPEEAARAIEYAVWTNLRSKVRHVMREAVGRFPMATIELQQATADVLQAIDEQRP